MSTTELEQIRSSQIFKDRRGRTRHRKTCGALPVAGPYLRLIRFQGGRTVKKKRELFPGAPAGVSGFVYVTVNCQVSVREY